MIALLIALLVLLLVFGGWRGNAAGLRDPLSLLVTLLAVVVLVWLVMALFGLAGVHL